MPRLRWPQWGDWESPLERKLLPRVDVIDRDSELVASIYDERNEAVLRIIEEVITVAKARKRKIGICGDAPSTYPEFAKFLVDCKIDSISLSPDAVMKTRLLIAKHEKKKR